MQLKADKSSNQANYIVTNYKMASTQNIPQVVSFKVITDNPQVTRFIHALSLIFFPFKE